MLKDLIVWGVIEIDKDGNKRIAHRPSTNHGSAKRFCTIYSRDTYRAKKGYVYQVIKFIPEEMQIGE